MSHPAEVIPTEWVSNHHYKVRMLDHTVTKKYIDLVKPEKEKGEKYSEWLRFSNNYDKHYANTPYWVQVEFWGDDDMLEQIELSNKTDMENLYYEISTCDYIPDFDKLGFR